MNLNLEQLRIDYKFYRKKNPVIAERILGLIEFTKIEMSYSHLPFKSSKRMEAAALLQTLDLSDRTIQRRKKNYREFGAEGLAAKEIPGKPAEELPDNIKKIISSYREQYRWGSEVIQAHMKFDHGEEYSRFKIDRYLKISGLREKYPCTTKKKQKAEKKKKHTSVVKVDNPGEHTQIDVKYQTHLQEDKQKSYVYNIVDHASNWSYKYPYSAYNAKNTKDFMERVLRLCPFIIMRLQSDNGVEFTNKYTSVSDDPKPHLLDIFCEKNGIVHKLVPPGEKELQGLVERSHRQDDQELYSRISPGNLKEFREKMEEYYIWRNDNRRFKKLGWKTPNEWLEAYNSKAILTYYLVTQKFCPGQNSSESSEAIDFEKSKKILEDEFKQKLKEEGEKAVKYGKLAA